MVGVGWGSEKEDFLGKTGLKDEQKKKKKKTIDKEKKNKR